MSTSEVDHNVDEREQQDDRLDGRIVARQHGVDRQPAEARDREDALGHDDAADQQRHAEADDRDDRHRRIAQGMAEQHLSLRSGPWRAPCECSPRTAPPACWCASSGRSARHRSPTASTDGSSSRSAQPPTPSADALIALHRQPIQLRWRTRRSGDSRPRTPAPKIRAPKSPSRRDRASCRANAPP